MDCKGKLDGSKCPLGDTLSLSDNIFMSSFSSLLSFTFCNCLNLSCKRAMEELTLVASPLCLPIEFEAKLQSLGGVGFGGLGYNWLLKGQKSNQCIYIGGGLFSV